MFVNMKKALVATAVATPLLAAFGWFYAAGQEKTSKETIPQLAKTRHQLALTYYKELTRLDASNAGIPAETFYTWSRHILDAELDLSSAQGDRIKAYEKHLGRMKELETRARKQTVGNAPIPNIEYYRVEAELMLARAR